MGGTVVSEFQSWKLEKLLKSKNVSLDNVWYSGISYSTTTAILIIFCGLSVLNDFIGKPIDCMILGGPSGPLPKVMQFGQAVNQYCYITSTYTVLDDDYSQNNAVGLDVPHPGIRAGGDSIADTPQRRKELNYYQWVPFMLLFQAVLFYFPHYVWKNFIECETLKKLLTGMTLSDQFLSWKKAENPEANSANPYKPKEWVNELDNNVKLLAEYLVANPKLHKTKFSAFVFYQIMNFVMVISNIYFTDHFLGGRFLNYGSEVLNFPYDNPGNKTDPMDMHFPKMTKCDWRMVGPTGGIQIMDALCILAVNIINEKIYLFLWFWFIIVSIVSGTGLIHLIMEAFSSEYRTVITDKVVGKSWAYKKYLSHSRNEAGGMTVTDIRTCLNTLGVSDWWIIIKIVQHLHPIERKTFLETVANELRKRSRLTTESVVHE